jgi:A/G-specific adenine glycosylase
MKKSIDGQRDFAQLVITWQRRHGRHDLPWQGTRDPYAIWVSEIMLQQTQVQTVIPYFARFMARFPDVQSLAQAAEGEVLALWSGLGYYARGRNLHKAAQAIVSTHGGHFPHSIGNIEALPGIGRSTAAAIAVFAFGAKHAILDGNVKRILARCFGIAGYPGEKKVEARLWKLAGSLLPASSRSIASYIQGQMDLGATLCTRTRPGCAECPLTDVCIARQRQRIADFPGRKPRKALPVRDTAMLILISQYEVLFERRPASGVWGGLWCFPELPADADVLGVARNRYGVAGRRVQNLTPLVHGFTHFKLTIHPRIVHASSRTLRAAQPGTIWMSFEDAEQAAIPTPVRKLLAQLPRV